jgi:hypothetical protein
MSKPGNDLEGRPGTVRGRGLSRSTSEKFEGSSEARDVINSLGWAVTKTYSVIPGPRHVSPVVAARQTPTIPEPIRKRSSRRTKAPSGDTDVPRSVPLLLASRSRSDLSSSAQELPATILPSNQPEVEDSPPRQGRRKLRTSSPTMKEVSPPDSAEDAAVERTEVETQQEVVVENTALRARRFWDERERALRQTASEPVIIPDAPKPALPAPSSTSDMMLERTVETPDPTSPGQVRTINRALEGVRVMGAPSPSQSRRRPTLLEISSGVSSPKEFYRSVRLLTEFTMPSERAFQKLLQLEGLENVEWAGYEKSFSRAAQQAPDHLAQLFDLFRYDVVVSTWPRPQTDPSQHDNLVRLGCMVIR